MNIIELLSTTHFFPISLLRIIIYYSKTTILSLQGDNNDLPFKETKKSINK